MRITEEFLDAMFSRIGYVQDCVVKHYELDVNPHRQLGYGFVYFAHQEDALRAIRHFKQQTVDGVYFDCNACFTVAPPAATATATAATATAPPPPPQPAATNATLPATLNVSLGGPDDADTADADEERARKAQEASPTAAEAAHRVAAAQRSPHASQARPHSSNHNNAHYAASSSQPPALAIVSSRSASTAASPRNLSSHSAHSGSSSASSPFADSGPPSGRPPALTLSSHHSFHGRSPALSPYAQLPPPHQQHHPPQHQPQHPQPQPQHQQPQYQQPQQSPQPSDASAPPVGTPVATLLSAPGTPHAQPLLPGHFLPHSLPAPAAAPHGLLSYSYPQQPSPTAHAYGAQYHGGHAQQLMAPLPLAALPLHSLPVPAQAYYYPVVQPHGHAHAPLATPTPTAPLMVGAAGVPPPYALPGDYPPHYQRFGESKSSAMAPPFDFYAANAPPMAAPSSLYVAQSYAYEQPPGPPPGFVYYAAHAAAGHHSGDSCGPDAPPGDRPAPRY